MWTLILLIYTANISSGTINIPLATTAQVQGFKKLDDCMAQGKIAAANLSQGNPFVINWNCTEIKK